MKDEELKKPLPVEVIKSRKQGSANVSYIEGFYVIDVANEIFGYGKWDKHIVDLRMVNEAKTARDRGESFDVHYICLVRITVGETTYEDVGYGNGISYKQMGEAHELATKEAVTDGMKRCFRHFGSRFGNSLYRKGPPPTPPKDERPRPTRQEEEVLKAICDKLIDSVPDGLVLLDSRVDEVIYALKTKYPSDPKTVGAIVAYLISGFTNDSSWNTVCKKA